jgi:hypothetical protein
MSDWFPRVDVPTLPVVDLVTGRRGSAEEEVVDQDLYDCQVRWDFVHVYRLDLDRRQELCTLLTKLISKAPEMKGSEIANMWAKVAKDPEWPDRVMAAPEAQEDMDDG